jgi:hypothetical protein
MKQKLIKAPENKQKKIQKMMMMIILLARIIVFLSTMIWLTNSLDMWGICYGY